MIGQNTSKIVVSKLIHVSEADSSVASEKTGCVRSLEELQKEQFQVHLLATDLHASIAKFMRERNKEKHEYDIWHVTKSIKKKPFKKMTKKDCSGLADWTKAITSHHWWSAKNCDRDEKKLRERFGSAYSTHC